MLQGSAYQAGTLPCLSFLGKEGIHLRPAVGADTLRHAATVGTGNDLGIFDDDFLFIFDTITHIVHRISSV